MCVNASFLEKFALFSHVRTLNFRSATPPVKDIAFNLLHLMSTTIEPVTSLRYKLARAPIEDSDQPAHPHRLIRVVDGHSIGCHESNLSSGGKLRL